MTCIGVPTIERNIERFSDESSKKADSDSYLDTWTDSDPTPMNASPPKTGNNDEKKVLYTYTNYNHIYIYIVWSH